MTDLPLFAWATEPKPSPVGPRLCNDPKSLEDRARAFDAANPQVWVAFRNKALRLLKAGRKYHGAKAIMEVVRYDMAIEAGEEETGLKINNSYVAWYARKWREQYPHHAHFFRVRASEFDE